MLSDRKKLEKFLEYREKSIEELEKGLLTRRQYLELNYNFIQGLNLRPFSLISSYEEAIYNYQFYNILAKKSLSNAENAEKRGDKKKKAYYLNLKDNYYCEKDKATYAIVSFTDSENLLAYYIETDSMGLRNNLFEIYVKDRKYCILHTKSEKIKTLLKDKKIRIDKKRKSLINEYVNNKRTLD